MRRGKELSHWYGIWDSLFLHQMPFIYNYSRKILEKNSKTLHSIALAVILCYLFQFQWVTVRKKKFNSIYFENKIHFTLKVTFSLLLVPLKLLFTFTAYSLGYNETKFTAFFFTCFHFKMNLIFCEELKILILSIHAEYFQGLFTY